MKPLSTTRKLSVLRHAQSLCVLPPNKSLLLASPHSPFTIVLRFCQPPGAWCCLPCFGAQPRRTSTPHLPSIEFASGPHPPQPRAASFKRLYRTRARTPCSRALFSRTRASDKSLTRSACVKSFFDLVLVSIASPIDFCINNAIMDAQKEGTHAQVKGERGSVGRPAQESFGIVGFRPLSE